MDIRRFLGKRNSMIETMIAMLGMAMLVVVLFSAVFVASESQHDCDGDECPICAVLQQCENNLNQLGSGIVPLAVAVMVVFYLIAGVSDSGVFRIFSTPVSNMVRLNN
ncbi:hypothetical protein [Butyrivibrio sp. VCD2006]|uniref:hypothetical protein n=1 Tax=Butyrivibrio sp. VCD2006 TaxID=1280664 RepID=UPI0003FBEF4F|nr:hypothetical protein [Butyrivibrio sp. VCD2006]